MLIIIIKGLVDSGLSLWGAKIVFKKGIITPGDNYV